MIEIVTGVTLTLLVGLIVFQIALAAGAPLGRFAWGGKFDQVLPAKLRVASLVAVPLLVLFGIFVAHKPGWVSLFDGTIVTIGLWIIFAQLVLNTLGNLASKSSSERKTMALISGILAVCVLLLALN